MYKYAKLCSTVIAVPVRWNGAIYNKTNRCPGFYTVRKIIYKVCFTDSWKGKCFCGRTAKKFTETGVCKISVADTKTKPHLHSWSFCAIKFLNETDVSAFLSLADMNHRCPLAKITIGNTLY